MDWLQTVGAILTAVFTGATAYLIWQRAQVDAPVLDYVQSYLPDETPYVVISMKGEAAARYVFRKVEVRSPLKARISRRTTKQDEAGSPIHVGEPPWCRSFRFNHRGSSCQVALKAPIPCEVALRIQIALIASPRIRRSQTIRLKLEQP